MPLWAAVPGPHCSLSKQFLPNIQPQSFLFQFKAIPYLYQTRHPGALSSSRRLTRSLSEVSKPCAGKPGALSFYNNWEHLQLSSPPRASSRSLPCPARRAVVGAGAAPCRAAPRCAAAGRCASSAELRTARMTVEFEECIKDSPRFR